jgi:adenylate cyclase
MKKILLKILVSPWLALATLGIVLSVRIADPNFVESVRLRYFDTLITSEPSKPTNIFTINIDEATLDKYGQWPFNREIYADLISDLYARKAGLVVWDVMMPETDRQGGDKALAAVLDENPVVLANMPAEKSKNKAHVPGSAVMGPEFLDRIIEYPGLISNVSLLEDRAYGVGTVNTLPEVDGVVRRAPLIATVDKKLYPSLAMEALRAAAGDTTFQVKLNALGVEKMRIPKFGPIATDNLGRVWIDWSQRAQSVSAVDLLENFEGAVVIVGVSAAGISNPVPTAVGSVWPQDLQAAVISTMIAGSNIKRPDWADGAEILAMLVMGLLLVFFAVWRRR